MGVMSLSEENKTHIQRLGSSPRSEFLDMLAIFDGVREVSYWINWPFLVVFFLVL